MNTLPNFQRDGMATISGNTLPDDTREKILDDYTKVLAIKVPQFYTHQVLLAMTEYAISYAKAYAPVPGKENICPVCGGNHFAISPSTASNEDKHHELDLDLIKQYPLPDENEMTPFGATLKEMGMPTIPKQSNEDKTITTNRGANANEHSESKHMDKRFAEYKNQEPKAVQQAAKEWKQQNAKFVYDDQSAMMLENAFLAGASFNKDAVEENIQTMGARNFNARDKRRNDFGKFR